MEKSLSLSLSLSQSAEIQPEDKSKPTEKSQFPELLDQVKAIPWTSLWNLALVVGGLFLITYFASIGFLPDLDLKAIAGTVASVAMIGLFVVVNIGMGLILPTLFLRPADDRSKVLQMAEPLLGICLAYAVFLSFNLSAGLPLVLAWVIFGGLLVVIYLYLIYRFSGTKNRIEILIMFGAIFLWCTWALIFPMLYYAFLASHNGQDDWFAYFKLFIFPLLFAVISLVVATLPKHKRATGRLVASIGAVFILGFFSNRPAFVPQTAVAVLGLSVHRSPVTLILSETGCSNANLILEGRPCVPDQIAKIGYLRDTKIISRIGAQFVIDWKPITNPVVPVTTTSQTTDGQKKEIWRRVVFRKEDVLSWAYESPNLYVK